MAIETFPSTGGGGQPNMNYIGSIHMPTYNRNWAQGGSAGYYALYSTNQENGYVYFNGATTTGGPLNRLISVSHSFTSISIIAPVNDMISLYKAQVKSTTEFANPFAAFSSFPSVITSSGNFVLPNNALPLVNVAVIGAGGNGGHHYCGGGGGAGGFVKLTAFQAVGTTSVTIGSNGGDAARTTAGSTYFGNVYALGGAAGGHHDNNGATSGGANGAGGGGHNSQQVNRNGTSGTVQTASTGLGTAGSPVYVGGHSGGNAGPNDDQQSGGGGGGGAGGAGSAGNTSVAGNGGAGHASDITGTNTHYCYGAPGGRANNGSQSFGSYTGTTDGNYGAGGRGAGYQQQGRGNGQSGAVIVRYYIP